MENENRKITDLNSDCKEIIFEYLEFYDLLRIADSSKQFYNAVCRVFKRKYSDIELLFERNLLILRGLGISSL